MVKLIVAYIVENDEDVFQMSYNSIKDVSNEVVVIDGNKKQNHYTESNVEIHTPYPHKDKGANGMQRNKYLDYVKEHHLGDWCLVLDADEIVDHSENIIEVIRELELEDIECASLHMRHFINNLAHEDSTQQQHFVPCRLFKITKDLHYDEVEHPVLKGIKNHAHTAGFCVWHLAYAREMLRLKNKYLNHKEKSNIHTPQYLEQWYHAHLFGEYPVSKIDPISLPKVIKEAFLVNDDYLYFRNRGVELKHAEMVKQWDKHFSPDKVLDIGCGRGPYLRYWEMVGAQSHGLELSQWAIDNKICDSIIIKGDIVDSGLEGFDLVTAIDILEHLEYKKLDKALKNIYNSGKQFLFSIPFLGDPNLEADTTHIIKKPKAWWISKLKKSGFKIKDTPEYFLFEKQIIIAEKWK